jgi:tRNA 5-methylaminomethyl-2-thiouridine biosynthesis bifunctional protein
MPHAADLLLEPAQIDWRDGAAHAPRYGDRYASASGALAQARAVFLAGCGLPEGWAGRASYTVLENGFGLGLNFLACWQAWAADPRRPARLHYVALEAHPVDAAALLHAARQAQAADDEAARAWPAAPPLAELAERLAAQWPVALPGWHRLEFGAGGLRLTLAFGDARRLAPRLRLGAGADALFLDGFAPRLNPQMWEPPLLKALARQCRPGARLASWCVAGAVRKALGEAGFVCERRAGLPPKRHALAGMLGAPWLRRQEAKATPAVGRARVLVVGAGLAGALAARALAERGLQVTVLDAAPQPAAGGASALPVGLAAAHWSPDDAPLSRLSRAGLALLRLRLAAWSGSHGGDGTERWFDLGGIDERPPAGSQRPAAPAGWDALPGFAAQCLRSGADGADADGAPLVQHMQAGWVRPAALAAAALAHPAIAFVGAATVEALRRLDSTGGGGWQPLDAEGRPLADATDIVVLAQALASAPLAAALGGLEPAAWPLGPVHGRVLWGHGAPPGAAPGASRPYKADGAFLVPAACDALGRPLWQCGATHRREPAHDDAHAHRAAERDALWTRLARLVGPAGAALPATAPPAVQDWAGTRCASPDRLPLVGALPDARAAHDPTRPLAALPRVPGIYAACAFGGRGLTLAPLAAELLAAQICAEPQPLPAELIDALDPGRFLLAHRRRRGG